MTDLSSFTHKWRAAPNANHTDASKVSKRNRQPTSCQACRARKLKCDKGHPCEACTKRGEEGACSYGKVATTQPARRAEPKASSKAQDRLRQLEDLVRQLIKPADEERQRSSPSSKDNGSVEGPLNRDRHGVNYTGSTHWSAVLDQIQDLRSSLSTDPSPEESNDSDNGIGLRSGAIFGAVQPSSLPIILQSCLPPRKQVDRYLSSYFNAKFMVVPFVHTGQFQRQYENFWPNQADTSPMWVSILFSIICLSNLIRKATGAGAGYSPDEPPAGDHYLAATAQCLVLGDYTKPQPHLIEALAMYAQCKYALSLDPNREIGLILSILTRQAYTMGYHRDPSKFPGQFTPFEGEQRRRCWSAVKQFDIMTAFQLGIPQNFLPGSSDTLPPRNILDSDFDEDTNVLPPARSETEPTPMLYFCTKAKLMDVYSKIVGHSLSFPSEPPTNIEVMALHAEITQAMESIPLVLRTRPISLSYSDPAYLIMLRTNLLFVGEKTLCVLHRKYMGDSTSQGNFSRKVCLESCTRLVTYFIDLHAELAPGGQLYQGRWMMTSFIINDFLLTTMLLCITIWQSQKNFVSKDSQNLLEQDVEARSHFELLEKAQRICAEYSGRSVETKHVAEVLSHVLNKIRSASSCASSSGRGKASTSTPNYHLNVTGATYANSSPEMNPATDDAAQMPLDFTTLSMSTQSNAPGPSPPSNLSTIFGRPTSTTASTGDVSATWTFNSAPAITAPPQPLPTQDAFLPPTDAPSFSPDNTNTNTNIMSPFGNLLETTTAGTIDWISFDRFLNPATAFDPTPDQDDQMQMQSLDHPYGDYYYNSNSNNNDDNDNGNTDTRNPYMYFSKPDSTDLAGGRSSQE